MRIADCGFEERSITVAFPIRIPQSEIRNRQALLNAPQSTTIRHGKKTKTLPKFSASDNSISTVQ
jgi:hypothetical protein